MAVYQMSIAMLERTVELQAKLSTAERQLAVAKRNKQERKKESLVKQIESWKRTVDDLQSFVSEMTVSTIIIKRYRDNSEFARVATLEALSQFCVTRPDLYVTNMYLKYFGWMLSDLVPAVRVAAVKGLLVPLENESVDPEAMEKVLSKFLSRLTDMTADTDTQVQDSAMALLLKLLRTDYFENVEDDRIWEHINSMALLQEGSPTFRRDALYFVLDQLSSFDSGTAKTEREAVDQLDQLAQWLARVLSDSDIPIEDIEYYRADLVVSSLRSMPEHMSLATNWSAMLRALQSEKSHRRSKLSEEHRQETVKQLVLLRLFVTAVKMEVSDASSEVAVVYDPLVIEAVQANQDSMVAEPPAKATKKSQKKSDDTHEDLTLALLRSLPDLLMRFKSETGVLASLTTLPQYFCK